MDQWLLLQTGSTVYIALFGLLMGGTIGLPIPEDIPLILAGVLAHLGRVRIEGAALVCYVAIMLGDIVIFAIGRRLGPALFQKSWFKRRFTPHRIRTVRFRLERRSLLTILIARHLFYVRTITFLTCGAVHMNFMRFFVADAIAALVSMPIMIGIGYLAAEHYQVVLTLFEQAKFASLLLIAALLATWLMYNRRKKGVAAQSRRQI